MTTQPDLKWYTEISASKTLSPAGLGHRFNSQRTGPLRGATRLLPAPGMLPDTTRQFREPDSAATGKLGIKSREAGEIVRDLGGWTIHRPGHGDLLKAAQLHNRHKIAWWDALIVNSAIELGCQILWTEDLPDGQRYGSVTVRHPFRR